MVEQETKTTVRQTLIFLGGLAIAGLSFKPCIYPITRAAYHAFVAYTLDDDTPHHPLEASGGLMDLFMAGFVAMILMGICFSIAALIQIGFEKKFPGFGRLSNRILF